MKLDFIKEAVLQLPGYVSPPQRGMKAKLNQNESPFDIPAELKSELLQKFARLEWNRYPENESPGLKAKLAELHGVEPEQVLLGNGSNQLLQTILTATIDNSCKILYCPPTFSLFDLYVPIYGGTAVEVDVHPGEPFPLTAVLQAIDEHQPRAILLCSPNNPTGAEISRADIEALLDRYNGLLLLDEAYGEFSTWTAVPMIREHPNLIVSRTFSKAYSLAGLRFGYLIGDKTVIDQLRKVNLPYNINLLTEAVAVLLLEKRDFVERQVQFLLDEKDRVYTFLKKCKRIDVYPSQANFLLFKCPDSRDLFEKLKERGVLVRDVSGYKLLENHLRVNVGSREENDLFMQELSAILKEDDYGQV